MDITCSVCTESLIAKDDSVSTTRCGHVFHTKCVTQWFQTGNNNCPQCRAISGANQTIQTYFSKNAKALDVIEADINGLECFKSIETVPGQVLQEVVAKIQMSNGRNLIERPFID